MSNDFITRILSDYNGVKNVSWESESVVEISPKKHPPFKAAILRERLVEPKHVEPFLKQPVAVIANFPKIGRWTGAAIALCEERNKAWGQWSVLLRAVNSESPETTDDPKISFSRIAISQHTRVEFVGYIYDRLLAVRHENGKSLRVALLYEYDLCGDDVRRAWDELKPFDILLKTNPNGSLLEDAEKVGESIGIKVFKLGELFGYLAKGKF